MALRTIARSAGWLGLVQILNYALPVVMVPIVTRALGPSLYGVYALGISYGTYCYLLTDYGFYLEATRLVAQNRDDLAVIRRTHSVVFAGKLLLAATALAALLAVMRLSGASPRDTAVFLLLGVSSMVWAVAPVWLFVALDRAGEMGAAQIASRAVFAVGTLLLLHSPADLVRFALLQLASYCGLALYLLLRLRALGIVFCRFAAGDLRRMLAGSAKFFVGNVASGAYTASSVIIVRQVASLDVVGHFALAERIRGVLASVVTPFSLAIYPFVSAIGVRAATRAERRTKTIYTTAMLVFTAAIGAAAFLARHAIVRLLAGSGFAEAATFIGLFAATPLLTALNNLASTQTLVAQGRGREAVAVQLSGAVFGVALSAVMAVRSGPLGVAVALPVTDVLVVSALLLLCRRRRPRPVVGRHVDHQVATCDFGSSTHSDRRVASGSR